MFGLENVPIFNFSLHLNADVTKCRQFFESFAAVAVLGVGVLVISPLAVSFLANKLQLIYYTDQSPRTQFTRGWPVCLVNKTIVDSKLLKYYIKEKYFLYKIMTSYGS